MNIRRALRSYVRGDCEAILADRDDGSPHRALAESDYVAALTGFCLELGGSTAEAQNQYEALLKSEARSVASGWAKLRLHQLRTLLDLGLNRAEFAERVKSQAKEGGNQDPVPTRRVAPYYPPSLSIAGITGWSSVGIELSNDGKVSGIQPIDSSPPFLFDLATVLAVSQWEYDPPADPASRFLLLRIKFELD